MQKIHFGVILSGYSWLCLNDNFNTDKKIYDTGDEFSVCEANDLSAVISLWPLHLQSIPVRYVCLNLICFMTASLTHDKLCSEILSHNIY